MIKAALVCVLAAAVMTSCSIRKIGETEDTKAKKSVSDKAMDTAEEDITTATEDASGQVTEDATGQVTDAPETHTEAPETHVEPQVPAGEYEPIVFMYHLILDEPYSVYENLFVRPSEFESQLAILNSLGYRYAFADEYGTFEYPTAMITLDDGYEDNYTEMFPILKKAGAKATVFLATSLVGTDGYLTEDQIREMAGSGLVSFQSHTVDHGELTYYDADGIADQITRSAEYIESLTGKKVTAFAYPAGRFNDFVLAETAKHVRFAYTTESPSARSVVSDLAIPRYRVPRGYPDSAFREIAEGGMEGK